MIIGRTSNTTAAGNIQIRKLRPGCDSRFTEGLALLVGISDRKNETENTKINAIAVKSAYRKGLVLPSHTLIVIANTIAMEINTSKGTSREKLPATPLMYLKKACTHFFAPPYLR